MKPSSHYLWWFYPHLIWIQKLCQDTEICLFDTMNCADFKQSSFGSLMDCSDEINNQWFWLGRGTKYLQDMSTGELQRIWFTKNKCFIPLKIRKIWFLREQNFQKLLIFHFVVHVDLRFIIDHSSSTFWSNIYLILNTIVVSFLR